MADSENSRTFPAITRRKMLSTAAAAVVSMTTEQADATPHSAPDNDASLLALWREWKSAHQRRCELTVLQQRLETKLWRVAEKPMGALHIPRGEKTIFAHSAQEIERLLPQADMGDIRNHAIGDLRSRQREWDRTGWERGYNQACEEEVKAERLEWELAETLWNRSANSLDGVVAKLHSMIEMAGPDNFMHDDPVRVLRSIHDDLRRITDRSF